MNVSKYLQGDFIKTFIVTKLKHQTNLLRRYTWMGWVPLQMISVTILTLALAPGLTGSSPAPGCVSCRYSMIATLWVRVRSEQQF